MQLVDPLHLAGFPAGESTLSVIGRLDVVALAAIVLTPILGLVSLDRHGWRQSRLRIAYLGYACCAVLAASFAMHFYPDGGEIYMVFVFWLVPFAVAAAAALLMTLAIRSNRTLWSLGLATILLGLAQVGAGCVRVLPRPMVEVAAQGVVTAMPKCPAHWFSFHASSC